MLNSLYGKFGQRYNPQWAEVGKEEYEYTIMYRDNPDMERYDDYYDGTLKSYWQIGDRLWAQSKELLGLDRASICSIAGYITSKARAYLWQAMAMVLDVGGQLYMTDTDSIVTDKELPPSEVSPTELGKWKLEKITPGLECYFTAPKHYRMGEEYHIKGIRNPNAGDNETGWEQVVFPRFMTDLTSANSIRGARLERDATLSYITKNPTGFNLKRVEVGDDRPTEVLVLARHL